MYENRIRLLLLGNSLDKREKKIEILEKSKKDEKKGLGQLNIN